MAGSGGDGGPASSAQLNLPTGVAVSSAGLLFIVDSVNHKIRLATSIITTYAGTGVAGSDGDGGVATSAQLNFPEGVSVSSSGLLYIADSGNCKIRVVTSTGIITTYAGGYNSNYGYCSDYGDGLAATIAQLNGPRGLALSFFGLYIADYLNNKIRFINSTGIIITYAGTGWQGSSGDGGAATNAQLYQPFGVAVSSSGLLYIADSGNNKIRVVSSAGIITTYAGNGASGTSGDGGAAINAFVSSPLGVAVDSSDVLYIADYRNKIRMVTNAGTISTYAGTGTAGNSGDGGVATSAQLNNPYGVAVGASGILYIVDTKNNNIRLCQLVAVPTTIPTSLPTTMSAPVRSTFKHDI